MEIICDDSQNYLAFTTPLLQILLYNWLNVICRQWQKWCHLYFSLLYLVLVSIITLQSSESDLSNYGTGTKYAATFSITAPGIMTLCITTLGIAIKNATHNVMTLCALGCFSCYAECLYTHCLYAEYLYANLLYAKRLYAKRLYARSLYAKCLYDKCLMLNVLC